MDRENKTHWTTNDLAEKANLNSARIRQLLIEDKELHGYKLGRDWVVPNHEAERWLETRGIEID